MAVVGPAVEKYSSRSGSEALTGGKRYTRIFLVKTDHTGDGAKQVRLAAELPRVGDPYSTTRESDGSVLCQSVSPNQIGTYDWEVTCQYATQSAGGSPGGTGDPERQNENPLLRPVDVAWGSVTYQRAIAKDINGVPISNSAGVPLDPPLQIDQSRLVLTITRNEEGFDQDRAIEYSDVLNQDEFFGRAPGEAKMSTPRAILQYENAISFWRVTYEIHFHPDGWQERRIDNGHTYWELVEIVGNRRIEELKPFKAGDQPGVIGLLDGNGEPLSDERRQAGDFEFIVFEVYESKDFSVFNLEPED